MELRVDSAAERLKAARERLRKAERRAHPDVGELAGARADVSFYVRLLASRGKIGEAATLLTSRLAAP